MTATLPTTTIPSGKEPEGLSFSSPELGIDDPDLARLTAIVLSRLVFGFQDRSGSQTDILCRVLVLYANTAVEGSVQPSPAPCPDVDPEMTISARRTVRRALGLSFQDEQDEWSKREAADDDFAYADLNVLAAYIPLELWKVLAAIIQDGPTLCKRRIMSAMLCERSRKVRPTRRRPSGGYLAQATISNRLTQARRIMRVLSDQAQIHPHFADGYLEQWRVRLPKLDAPISKAGVASATDTSAIPGHLVRRTYQRLDAEVRERLRLTYGQDELAAIRSVSVGRAKGLHRPLRARAIVELLSVLAPRVSELAALNRGDYDPSHPHLDGEMITPAVRIHAAKTQKSEDWRPLPPGAEKPIEAYLEFVDRVRMLHALPPLGEGDPLFLSSVSTVNRYTKDSIEALIGGGTSQKALIPIDRANPNVGYRPHSFRKTLKQWCSSFQAAEWCKAHRVDPARREAIGEAMLSHTLTGMVALYKDDASEAGKQRLRYLGASIAWEMLTTDLGARKIPDAEKYRRALAACQTLEAELAAMEREMEALARREERGERLIVGRMSVLNLNYKKCTNDLLEARREIMEIEKGLPEGQIAVSDELDDREVPKVDLKAIRQEVESGAHTSAAQSIRNWITPDEFAQVLGLGASTVRQWIREGLPASKAAWDHDDPPIVEFNKRRRAILADRIDPRALDSAEKRAALADLLAQDPPDGWGRFPLKVARPSTEGGTVLDDESATEEGGRAQ